MQIENQAHIREYVETAIAGVLDTTKLEKKHADLDERLQGTLSKTQALIEKNAREALDQDEFLAEHRKLADRCAVLMAEMDEVERKISEMRGREASIDEYLSTLEQVERLPIEFSRRIWNMTIDTVTVHEGKRLVFRWKDGTTSERISGQACA